jgi:hypothetical protein
VSGTKENKSVEEYSKDDMKEDDYETYERNLKYKLFTDEVTDYEETFKDILNAHEAEKEGILALGQRDTVIKPLIKKALEKFEEINKNLYLDLTNTLSYRHISYDNKIDIVGFGIQLIKKIKQMMIDVQKTIKFEDGSPLLDKINLFAYLKFKIVGGYIIIENENYDTQNIKRLITKELIPNLVNLNSEYDKPINYKKMTDIILHNKSSLELDNNSFMTIEALNILAQDYFICLQSKVEYLLWTLRRLILCWYSDPILNENIFKIKILINLYRARGIKEFNQEIGVQPVILIVPKYGKDCALKILSYLTYYFFPYKNVGWTDSSPSYFNKVDDLIYYTNGSMDLKRYIKNILETDNNILNPFSPDFTKIALPTGTNDIEH